MFCLSHIVENMFADNYKKNHKEHAAGEYPIVRGRGLGSKRTPGILIRVNVHMLFDVHKNQIYAQNAVKLKKY